MIPSLPRNTSLPLPVRAVFLNICFLFKRLRRRLHGWDTLLIVSPFTRRQGRRLCRALAFLCAHLRSGSPLSAPPRPLLSAILPTTTDTGGDDRAEPAPSSPRGFEPRLAQPARHASAGGHAEPLHPAYASPSPYCFPCSTKTGAQEDEILHRLLLT